MNILWIGLGLVLLFVGAEWLVQGSARLARGFGMPPLLVGLTVVAYGTSAPELAVSVRGALTGTSELAVGNAVGSNIFNLLVVLGLCAVILPLSISRRLIRMDVPLLALVSIATWLLARGEAFTRLEGALLVVGLVLYTIGLVLLARRDPQANILNQVGESMETVRGLRGSILTAAALALVGLGILVGGAQSLVHGATNIATGWGVPEVFIGLTIVAAGTSLPELATSVVASLRGERDIAVGNAVGSCMFNLLGVLGLSALLTPGGLPVPPDTLALDIPVMVAVTIACLPVFITGGTLSRWEGGAFLLYYGLYLGFLIHLARGGALPTEPHLLVLLSAFPAAIITLVLSLLRSQRQLEVILDGVSGEVSALFTDPIRQARRLIILVVGTTVILVGVLLLVMPGPGVLVVLIGLGILGTEFFWAKRLLGRLQKEARDAATRWMGRDTTTPD
jgi:cation:H+ antiporter